MNLTFNQVTFSPVERHDGQVWITSAELARALGYARADKVTQIYQRNADEFSAGMTQVIDISENLNLRGKGKLMNQARIFSLRGCHLIAMFARTDLAKAFRKWVLDLLDGMTHSAPQRTTKKQRERLNEAASLLWSRSPHLTPRHVWDMLHQRFGVDHVDQIAEAQLNEAVEYLHRLATCPPDPAESMNSSKNAAIRQLTHSVLMQNALTQHIWQAIALINPHDAGRFNVLMTYTNRAAARVCHAFAFKDNLGRPLIDLNRGIVRRQDGCEIAVGVGWAS